MLTPKEIQQANQITGRNVPPTGGIPVNSRADEIRNLAKQTQVDQERNKPLGQRNDETISNAGNSFYEGITGTGKYEGVNPVVRGTQAAAEVLSTPVKIAGNIVHSIGNTVAPELTKNVESGISKVGEAAGGVINWLGDKLGSTDLAQKFVQKHPDAAKTLEDWSKIGEAGGNIAGTTLLEAGGVTALKKGADLAKPIIQKGTNLAQGGLDKITGKGMTSPSDLSNSALKDVTPEYNKKLISEPDVVTPEGVKIPRVQEGGTFSGRTITSTQLEREASGELSKIKGYDPKASSLQKYNLINDEITSKAEDLTSSLKEENVLRPSREIKNVVKDAVNKTSEDSLLLQKSDPTIKQYMRVVNNAITKTDGTLAGELQVRKLMDAAYKNARGKMAFGDGKMSVLDEIHTSARDALNKDLMDNAINTDVKVSLKSQSLLYKAQDALLKKAEAEGGSSIEKLVQKHPVVKSLLNATGRITGLSKAIDLIK